MCSLIDAPVIVTKSDSVGEEIDFFKFSFCGRVLQKHGWRDQAPGTSRRC